VGERLGRQGRGEVEQTLASASWKAEAGNSAMENGEKAAVVGRGDKDKRRGFF